MGALTIVGACAAGTSPFGSEEMRLRFADSDIEAAIDHDVQLVAIQAAGDMAGQGVDVSFEIIEGQDTVPVLLDTKVATNELGRAAVRLRTGSKGTVVVRATSAMDEQGVTATVRVGAIEIVDANVLVTHISSAGVSTLTEAEVGVYRGKCSDLAIAAVPEVGVQAPINAVKSVGGIPKERDLCFVAFGLANEVPIAFGTKDALVSNAGAIVEMTIVDLGAEERLIGGDFETVESYDLADSLPAGVQTAIGFFQDLDSTQPCQNPDGSGPWGSGQISGGFGCALFNLINTGIDSIGFIPQWLKNVVDWTLELGGGFVAEHFVAQLDGIGSDIGADWLLGNNQAIAAFAAASEGFEALTMLGSVSFDKDDAGTLTSDHQWKQVRFRGPAPFATPGERWVFEVPLGGNISADNVPVSADGSSVVEYATHNMNLPWGEALKAYMDKVVAPMVYATRYKEESFQNEQCYNEIRKMFQKRVELNIEEGRGAMLTFAQMEEIYEGAKVGEFRFSIDENGVPSSQVVQVECPNFEPWDGMSGFFESMECTGLNAGEGKNWASCDYVGPRPDTAPSNQRCFMKKFCDEVISNGSGLLFDRLVTGNSNSVAFAATPLNMSVVQLDTGAELVTLAGEPRSAGNPTGVAIEGGGVIGLAPGQFKATREIVAADETIVQQRYEAYKVNLRGPV